MPKHRVLSLKPHLRLDWRGQDGQDETQKPDHFASLDDSIKSSTRMRFSVRTAGFLIDADAGSVGRRRIDPSQLAVGPVARITSLNLYHFRFSGPCEGRNIRAPLRHEVDGAVGT